MLPILYGFLSTQIEKETKQKTVAAYIMCLISLFSLTWKKSLRIFFIDEVANYRLHV